MNVHKVAQTYLLFIVTQSGSGRSEGFLLGLGELLLLRAHKTVTSLWGVI